jgi:Mn-containing catalase
MERQRTDTEDLRISSKIKREGFLEALYLKITGELDVDLRSNIAAEARAKIVYERLIRFTEDAGTIRALQFLMTREITHMKAFTAALESLGINRFSIGAIPPTPELVNQYFDDSTGTGFRGEPNARGPWNTGGDWQIVDAPAFKELASETRGTRQASNGHAAATSKANAND